MDIFIRNIAFAVTPEDLTIEFAKILHKPPFPTNTLLNFEVQIFYKQHPNGKRGVLALPTVDAGLTLLRAYGDTGIAVKGRIIFLNKSTQAINMARINRLNTVPWSDPVKLREEKERLLEQSRPFQLLRYSFGRFSGDGHFSSEVCLPGVALVSCDLDRRQVHFTLKREPLNREREQRGGAFDLHSLLGGLDLDFSPVVAASYAPLNIARLVGNQDEDTTTLFIRADAPPVFSVDNDPGGM
ncbi:hypothetical protein K503DRAFT_806537, partial [Rhizopogon vinicolor AM-OR11-026]